MTFLPTQICLIRFLHTEISGVIALHIIAIVFQFLRRYLTYISQHIGSRIVGITTNRLVLNEKTGITVQFFLQQTVFLDRETGNETLRRIRGIAGIETAIGHIAPSLPILVIGNTQRTAKIERIERLYLAGYHHKVVRRLVIDNQTPLPIVNKPTGRILYFGKNGIIIGQLIVLIVDNLQGKQFSDIKENYQKHKSPDNIFPPFVIIILSHRFFSISKSTTNKTNTVSNVLPTMRPVNSNGEKNENDSAQNSTVQKTKVRTNV